MSVISSRRRHTICLSDWSSDVCSSDLTSLMGACDLFPLPLVSPRPAGTPCRRFAFIIFDVRGLVVASAAAVENQNHEATADDHGKEDRSEERRVGKECTAVRDERDFKQKTAYDMPK